MSAENGHAANRSYFDQNGAFHLNGAAFYDSNEVDISTGINVVGVTANATELNYSDGTLPGVLGASKTVVADANGAVPIRLPKSIIAATGSGQANGNTLSLGYNYVTGATNTTCVTLPTPGGNTDMVIVKNGTAGNNLPVFPQSGATIDAASANAAVNISSLGVTIYLAHNSTQWFTK